MVLDDTESVIGVPNGLLFVVGVKILRSEECQHVRLDWETKDGRNHVHMNSRSQARTSFPRAARNSAAKGRGRYLPAEVRIL